MLPTPTRPPPPPRPAWACRLATLTTTVVAAVGLTLAPPACAAAAAPPPGTLLTGAARLADGDTLELTTPGGDTVKVRLWGVDAPERKQTCRRGGDGALYACGDAATGALAAALGDLDAVSCTVKASDQHGRAVAACAGPTGRDAGGVMVEQGWAVELPAFSGGAYADAQAAARDARRGVWAGPFLEPAEWRREAKIAGLRAAAARSGAAAAAGAPRPGGGGDDDDDAASSRPGGEDGGGDGGTTQCRVKGNVSARGAKIYYEPSHRLYDSVKINRAGERLFCSVREAEAAGWRAPQS